MELANRELREETKLPTKWIIPCFAIFPRNKAVLKNQPKLPKSLLWLFLARTFTLPKWVSTLLFLACIYFTISLLSKHSFSLAHGIRTFIRSSKGNHSLLLATNPTRYRYTPPLSKFVNFSGRSSNRCLKACTRVQLRSLPAILHCCC